MYTHIHDPSVRSQTNVRFWFDIIYDGENHGGGIAEIGSWEGNLGSVNTEASRGHLETARSFLEAPKWYSEPSRSTQEATRRHLGAQEDTQEAPGEIKAAKVFERERRVNHSWLKCKNQRLVSFSHGFGGQK